MNFHTGGPWEWKQNLSSGQCEISTPDRGRLLVMDFVRCGMRMGQPRFARRVGDDGGLMVSAKDWLNGFGRIESNPDAALIVAAPAMDAILQLCAAGKMEFDPATRELRFNGLRYSTHGWDWQQMAATIGWVNLRKALAER